MTRSGTRAPHDPTVRSAPRTAVRRAGAAARVVREPSVHRLYARLAWTTLDGLPMVSPRRVLAVESHIIALCRRLDVEPMEVRARADRLDLLVRFKPAQTLADVAAAVKAGSGEHLARRRTAIRWARGVAVATVAPDAVPAMMRRMAVLAEPGREEPETDP